MNELYRTAFSNAVVAITLGALAYILLMIIGERVVVKVICRELKYGWTDYFLLQMINNWDYKREEGQISEPDRTVLSRHAKRMRWVYLISYLVSAGSIWSILKYYPTLSLDSVQEAYLTWAWVLLIVGTLLSLQGFRYWAKGPKSLFTKNKLGLQMRLTLICGLLTFFPGLVLLLAPIVVPM